MAVAHFDGIAGIETDYLVVGAGAVGLAFADTLLEETDASITIVDRHGKPGGHWNDAYSFVSLHQPSAFYGVSSMPLDSGRKDSTGPNAGLYELATGAAVSAYFDDVMRRRLLPSGRVRYLPMTEHIGEGRVVSLLSGETTHFRARRRIVDATYFQTSVPSTHSPRFAIEEGLSVVPPNALPDLWKRRSLRPSRYVILGAGKTAMDVGLWLIGAGAPPASIQWVMPRDSWLMNRLHTQPGDEFFHEAIGGQLAQFTALAEATDLDDLFLRFEAAGVLLRIDRSVRPSMYHYATMSVGEIDILQRIGNVIRKGRVTALARGLMTLEGGAVAVDDNALFIDCTARAIETRPTTPIFQDGSIVLQMVRLPQPAFSAALIAHIEARYGTDAEKNALCTPLSIADRLEDFPAATVANMMNQFIWSQDKALRHWIRDCRLDGFGKVIAAVREEETDKLAVLAQFKAQSMAAVANVARVFPATGA